MMWEDFKKFAFRQGNFVDLAVAVVLGTAFNSIVSSFVDHLIMPLVGIFIGGIDVSGLTIEFGSATVQYGMFIQSIIDFFIIAFSIFLAIRLLNKFKYKEEKVEQEKVDLKEQLLREIRDMLKENKGLEK